MSMTTRAALYSFASSSRACWLAAALAFAAIAPAPDGSRAQSPASAPATGAASAPTSQAKAIRLPNVAIDLPARQILIDAEVCFGADTSAGPIPRESLLAADPNGQRVPLEVFLCKAGTKDYESVLSTKARPSDIHAGLLAMGLRPGKPARMSRAETQPSHFLPPEGARVAVTLRWKGADGNVREAPAGDWLVSAGPRKMPPPKEWVFVGSDVLPGGRYWADEDGDILSLSNFASAVLDVPFEHKAQWSTLEFAADARVLPPRKTPVQVVLRVLPGGEKAAAARVLIELDRFGQFWIEGRRYDAEALRAWAETFTERHAEGMAVLRAEGEARVGDLELGRLKLRLGGLWEVEEEKLMGPDEPPPRTADQAAANLKEWAERFATWDKMLTNPFDDARRQLQEVQRELREMEARKAMLGEYAAQLRAAMEKAEAATRPAGRR